MADYKIDFNACPTPIILVSEKGEIAQTNKRLDDLFGYESDELLGQLVEVLVPKEIRHYHSDLRDAFFQVPTTRRMGTGRDLHGVRKDGTMIPVEIGLDPFDVDGRAMVIVSILDIRERKNNELKIRRALNAASSAMIQVNKDGKIELVNIAAGEMFGYPIEEMMGQSIEILVPEQYRRKHTVYRDSYHNRPETRRMGRGQDLYGVRKDGSEFPVEIGLTPIDGEAGRSTMATINDITGRKNREKHIAQKNNQLTLLNDELLQFAYSASHDLKAPLASIVGLLGYCKSDMDEGNTQEALANIGKCQELASRLATRIEDMLSLAKSDMLDADWTDTNVRELVDDIWEGLRAENMQLETDYKHSEPFQTVSVRLCTILENLLSNAVKFHDTGREDNLVVLKTWNENENFCLSIEDNGIGIPSEQQGKVFNLFQRVSKTNKPGSGLGLALVKKNVIHLRGSIELEASLGKTKFSVSLPREKSIKTETENKDENPISRG